MKVRKAHFILYVSDQAASTLFYSAVLGAGPTLDVPGMTEFTIEAGCILGLMPRDGAARLFGPKVQLSSAGASGGEVYLLVEGPLEYHRRAIAAGAVEVSALGAREWGHEAAYSLDPDGYVLAFARELTK
jgi:uncharacterized protein